MRSQFILRRARLQLRRSSTDPIRALLSYSNPVHYPRKDSPPRNTRVYRRASSSSAPPPPSIHPPPPNGEERPPDDSVGPSEAKSSSTTAPDESPPPPRLPSDLDVLWTPESLAEPSNSTVLPPPEIYEEALNNLWITLHPQTQHKAAYTSVSGPPVEPTLALYCPIEGGDYIVDETVREMARRTKADVVVLDAVQLAAAQYGHFGPSASCLQLSPNPLHFASPSPSSARPARLESFYEDDETPDMSPMGIPSQMTFQIMTPSRAARTAATSPARGKSAAMRDFFDRLVNIPGPDTPGSSSSRRPRIIYVRDFGTLSASSASWFPALAAAVRQRRQGALVSPSGPVASPVTIVFGIAPPIAEPPSTSAPNLGGQGIVNLLMSRSSPSAANAPAARPGKSDWSEDEAAQKSREKRLRERLRKWEKGDAALYADLPKLSVGQDQGGDERGGLGGPPGVVVIGGSSGFSRLLESGIVGRAGARPSGPSESPKQSPFFRTSILVPTLRSASQEQACRMARRREINELTMRMGVGAVGGVLYRTDGLLDGSSADGEAVGEKSTSDTDAKKMWEDWGNRIENWSAVKQIADQAVGNMISQGSTAISVAKAGTLETVVVGWGDIHRAWAAQRTSHDIRKAWMQKSYVKSPREQEEADEDGDEGKLAEGTDEVVERLKQDPELDSHQQELLGCIVDATSMPTSFSQVHLPTHTIDAIRTMVSLPLLHPSAFQHGILKEHGMTGCLLFGPPGTGKTLVVRALAKEAGCRMLAISPSDVMDMYVGEGEKLVRAVFALARQLSPCVVFIDEIDALFGARSSARASGGAIAHRGVITQFMQEMDGLRSSREDNVIVIGATNRPFDLDDAVLRRLPRRLLVDLPGEKEREEILKILLRDESLASDIDLKALAQLTGSFSGSDLKHLCVAAALDAVKENVVVPWALTSQAGPVQTSPDKVPESVPAIVADVNVKETEPAEDAAKDAPPKLAAPAEASPPPASSRILHLHNFTKALKEITPSSSESLGSLADLRKWNEEFGEGRKHRKRQVWGKDRFGFSHRLAEPPSEEGKVAAPGSVQGMGPSV